MVPSDEIYVEPEDDVAHPHRRAPLSDDEMDITPMIDMTFLLLIFFLVAGRQNSNSQLELPPARHGSAVALAQSVILTVTVDESGVARVFRGAGTDAARQVDATDQAAMAEAIELYVQEQLTADPKKTSVLIMADRGVHHRDVAQVMAVTSKAAQGLYVAVLEKS